jgi:hypothetical protein
VITLVPRDASVRVLQCLDLGLEHLVIHQDPVAEDDHRQVSAGVLVIELRSVPFGERH